MTPNFATDLRCIFQFLADLFIVGVCLTSAVVVLYLLFKSLFSAKLASKAA